jgi:hypothetical protein
MALITIRRMKTSNAVANFTRTPACGGKPQYFEQRRIYAADGQIMR